MILRFVGIASLLLCCVGAILISVETISEGRFTQLSVYIGYFGLVPFVSLAAAYGQTRLAAHIRNERAARVLGAVLPLAVLLVGCWGLDRAVYHFGYEIYIDRQGFNFSSARFVAGCIVAGGLIAWYAVVRLRPSTVGGAVRWEPSDNWTRVFFGLFACGMFRIGLGHDSLSYDPYVGPASAVALGAIPMIDVFSQYGLNYLLLTLGLKVLPWSMYSTSLVISVLDMILYLVAAYICVGLSRDKLLAVGLSAFLIFFLVSAALYSAAYTPSVMAMRFLPGMLLLLALSRLSGGFRFRLPIVFALALSGLWSLEAAIFGFATCGAYVLCAFLAERPWNAGRFATRLAIMAGIVVMPHLLLAAGYLIFLGQWPRYDIYLQLVATQTKSSSWIVPADPAIRTWLIFGFTYGLSLAYGLYRSYAPESAAAAHRYAMLASIAVLGAMQFSYYAGRAVTPVLVFIAFPLMILFVLFVDDLVDRLRAQGAQVALRYRIYTALSTAVLIACGGVIADRFFREPFVLRSNATELRNCLSWGAGPPHCVRGVWREVRNKLRQPVGFVLPNGQATDANPANWQLIPTGMTLENMAAYDLGRKWLKGQQFAFLFIPDAATVLFALKKRNALGLTHAMVDDRSALLRERAMRAAEAISEGTIVMVGDMTQQPIERDIVDYLESRWTLERVDGGHSVVVYRVRAKG